MFKKDLLKKLKLLDLESDEQRNSITCSLIGHSKIIETCFGYIHCARCGDQIGDALGSFFDGAKHVIIGHACDTCHENYKELTWKDKLYCPDPFAKEVENG